jgi:aromatic-L-amino-acid/L-tryptophan decarboxylase
MASRPVSQPLESSLDPADWERFRSLAHEALDEAIELLRTVRERPVWRPVPEEVRNAFLEPVPEEGQGLEATYRSFQKLILPYPTGNIHPRFFG